MTWVKALSPSSFFKAWVSALVVKGERAIAPDQPATREALDAVRKFLDGRALASESRGNADEEFTFLDLRNQFLPTNTGAYDGVERALRNLQTSLVMSPNPDYEEIVLEVPQALASSLINSLSDQEREFVQHAANAYLDTKREVLATHR